MMCYACGRRMRGGSAVHASTSQHRRAIAPRSGGAWNRKDRTPMRSLRDWDHQYDEEEREELTRRLAPGALDHLGIIERSRERAAIRARLAELG